MPIVAKDFTVSFRRNQPTLANISLAIEDGEFVLVLGSSGSGKSVFALTLNGIIPQVIPAYVSGSLEINGLDACRTPVSQMATRVGLVFQDPDAQLVSMYVEDEIVFGPENICLSREEIGRRLQYALDMVGMQAFKNVHTWSLSGGQKQRVAIGSVLAMKPAVLVLDEPTSNLDPAGTRSVFELLARLRRETEITIIAIDHKIDDMIPDVDRVLVFDKGQIVVNGSPREVLAEHGQRLLEMGINLPMVSEVALEARRRGYYIPGDKLPLTVSEAVETLSPGQTAVGQVDPVSQPERVGREAACPPVIAFEGVAFSYPERPPALRDVDLELYPRELVAIVGQNGAGKTTLTKLIVGLLKASQGRVSLFGEDVSRMPIARLTEKVGYVFQYPDNQLVTDTVFDEVAFSMRIRSFPEKEVTRKVEEVLELVALSHQRKRHPLTLSMGEKRRLSVATMLVLDQDVLILDEPTMGMDWGHVRSVMEICRSLREAGKTILVVTHDMRVVAEWADRVVAMAEGQVQLVDTPQRFFRNREVLQRTHLAQPPICSLRACTPREDGLCQSCVDDFLAALLARCQRRMESMP